MVLGGDDQSSPRPAPLGQRSLAGTGDGSAISQVPAAAKIPVNRQPYFLLSYTMIGHGLSTPVRKILDRCHGA